MHNSAHLLCDSMLMTYLSNKHRYLLICVVKNTNIQHAKVTTSYQL